MTKRSRPRGSRSLWLDAAYDLLIEGGIDAVKVMALAKRINLTRTGFYWFFADLDELHRAMIQRWEDQNTGQLVNSCQRDAAGICEALFNLMECWLDPALFDGRLDLAIRNWSRVDDTLKKRVDDADRRRIDAVADMFVRHGYSQDQAEVRSLTVIYTQIGYISMDVTEDPAVRLARVPHYVHLFAGIPPSQTDVDRFLRIQHGKNPDADAPSHCAD